MCLSPDKEQVRFNFKSQKLQKKLNSMIGNTMILKNTKIKNKNIDHNDCMHSAHSVLTYVKRVPEINLIETV